MQFAAAGWLAALGLIPLCWLAVKAADRRAERLARMLLGNQVSRLREGWHPRLRGWQRFFYLAALGWLVLALARPQWGASEVSVTQRGHDVVIALDVSRSMLAHDVAPSRLERAKAELTSFLRRQDGGRVGLVLFAGAAFVQCPLTTDLATAEIFLQAASPDMISAQGTALAAVLRVGRELLQSGRPQGAPGGFQAILVVTDGEDLEGGWEQEAHRCLREGITVIPVGIGEESGGLIPITDHEGRPAGFLKDAQDNLVLTRLDLATLDRLAAIGGSSTFRVGIDGLAGERLRAILERLGKREFEERRVTRWRERFIWPLSLALLHMAVALAIRPRRAASGRPEGDRALAGPGPSGRHASAPIGAIGRIPALLGVLMILPAPALTDALVQPGWARIAQSGREAYARGDFAEALRAFEHARAREPSDPRLALAVGAALYRLGRHEEAAREFERARQFSARRDLQAESLFNSGTAALARGEVQEAIDHLRRSLILEPDRSDALHNLETALLQLHQTEQMPEQEPADRQDPAEDESEDDGQDGSADADQDQSPPPDDDPSPRDGDVQEQDTADREPPDVQDLDREQALRLLQALDRDEQDLQRDVRRRLRGPGAQSGREW